ncbi:MAG: hypothetical protein JWO14_1727 [Solirubrobacterales bacterium]|nr:hypothetical protein [Solirubrobacterales bacterium]
MLFGNVVLNGAAMVAVWLTTPGLGAMLGNFAAVALRRSADERSDWIALGGALGCICGLLVMLLAIGMLTEL